MIELQTVSEAAWEWLVRADNHLKLVGRILFDAEPLSDIACYHCQQAAELTLKGLLAYCDQPFPRTHDIQQLSGLLLPYDASLAELLFRARKLNEYIWQSRYPGLPIPPLEEARTAYALARELYQAVLDRVPEDARPK